MSKTDMLKTLLQHFEKEVEKLPVTSEEAIRWFRRTSGDISIEGRFIKNLKRKGYVID